LILNGYDYSKYDLETQRSRIVFTNPGKLYGNLGGQISGRRRDDPDIDLAASSHRRG